MRQRDRNRDRHQQRRAPLPEADQRDDHYQTDRFVQRVHEEVDLLFHLYRLVGGVDHHQVVGQVLLHAVQLLGHVPAEEIDLLAVAHVDSRAVTARLRTHLPLRSRHVR